MRPAVPLIRPEQAGDQAGVRAVNVAAFETPAEADLVDALRARARPLVSLVAEERGAIFGFAPGVRSGLGCEYDGRAEAFMVRERRPGALRGATGTVRYHAAFASR